MRSTIRQAAADLLRRLFGDATAQQKIATAATVMILAQLAFRAWATYGGWFYGDDLKFLSQASTTPLSVDYLFTRHQQQLMPGGLLISWLVGQGPAYSWPIAASTILAMQAMADLACLFMLTRLFGWRPGILIPLGLYLFSPLTLGAYMWWAAALNQLPLQIAFFTLIVTHVAYIRTRRILWALASVVILTLALLFYVKAVVMVPFVVLLTLGYLVEGRPIARATGTLRRYWLVLVGYLAVTGGYLGVYLSTGSSPVGTNSDAAFLETADRQIRQTLGSTLTGGPWRWLDQGRQDVLAHPPEFGVTLAWVVLTAVILGTSWHRVGAWRGWTIFAIYLIPTVYLTASGRTVLFGADVGLYVRYLSDVSVVACLVLALVTMPLLGSSESFRSLSPPVSVRPVIVGGALAFLVGASYSSFTYVDHWHRNSPAERYIAAAANDLKPLDGLSIIDEPVPEELVLTPNAPFNRPSKLLAPLQKRLRPVSDGTDLRMFGTNGKLGPAVVTPGISNRNKPTDRCVALVTSRSATSAPLQGRVTNETWWLSINYLASKDGDITVRAGENVKTLPVLEGPHTLFIRTTGQYGSVGLSALTPGASVCVDKITVGFIGTFS